MKMNSTMFALMLVALALPWPIRYSTYAIIVFCTHALFVVPDHFNFNKPIRTLVTLCFCYFLLHLGWWIFQQDAARSAWFDVEKKLALCFFPALLLNKKINLDIHSIRIIFKVYFVSLAVACGLCLLIACGYWLTGSGIDVFFYHTLCKPIAHHAVYLSAQIIIALLAWFFLFRSDRISVINLLALIFFPIMLILLSSKLMLSIFILLCLAIIVFNRQTGKSYLKFALLTIPFIAVSVLFIPQVKKRFLEIAQSNSISVGEQKYSQNTYFDGLQLRMIQLKIGSELIQVKNRWLIGMGPYDAQTELDKSYRDRNMYIGEKGNGGYLGLNFHNQYMETVIRFGLTGIIPLLLILYLLFKSAHDQKNRLLLCLALFFTVFFITESVLETQRGLILFLFFTLIVIKTPIGRRAND